MPSLTPSPRVARVPAFAKINLGLRVLNQDAEGFHELRTIFQTISLSDDISISFTPARRSAVALDCDLAIPDNLMVRAAKAYLEASGSRGVVRMQLQKRIPMGGGLGGGSTDAAAVLLALPVLTGRPLPREKMAALAATLGSDVPFFLDGGLSLGLGRGTELYPLPDLPRLPLVIAAPPVHVSTPEAYRAFGRAGKGALTADQKSSYINSFQSLCRLLPQVVKGEMDGLLENDFQAVVFPKHPIIASTCKQLRKQGAVIARMTGSGAALYAIFRSQKEASAVAKQLVSVKLAGVKAFSVFSVSRAHYQSAWRNALREHLREQEHETAWPLPSRYA